MAESSVRTQEESLLVVGGGPAGLAVALAAHDRGLAPITVIDAQRPPIDKPCGEGLMPDGRWRLAAWGVTPDPRQSRPFVGIRYVDGDTVAEGTFPKDHGLGVRRPALHAAMVDAAEQRGIRLRWGVKARALLPGTLGPPPGPNSSSTSAPTGIETDQGPFTARWVVAADGLGSSLAREAGLALPETRSPAKRRFGLRRHYRIAPWSDRVEVHWGDRAEAYVTPVGPEEVGIAFLWSQEKARFDELLGRFPRLAERLEGAPVTSQDAGRGALARRVRSTVRGNLALVGDASGYVDAITGEGLSLAFGQAELLAEALPQGDLTGYDQAQQRLRRFPEGLTRLMLLVERRPWLRRRTVRALAADPELFDRILGVHGGVLHPRALGLAGVTRLAWRLATS